MKPAVLSRYAYLLIVVCATVMSGCASTGNNWSTNDRFLHDVTVIDVDSGVAQRNQSLVIRDNRILAILPTQRIRLPENAHVIATGGFVMPGLWDMHVHALSDPGDALDRVFPLFILNGVTGIRDMGSLMPGVIETRARLAADASIPAPALFVGGPLLDGVKLRWYGDLPLVLDDAASVQRELPGLVEQGVDFFKVYDQLGAAAYEAVLAFATDNGMTVAGHAPIAAGIRGASEAGQSTIEHLSVFSLRECVDNGGEWFNRTIGAKFSGDYANYYRTVTAFFDEIDQLRCDQAYRAMAQAETYFTPTLVMEFNDRARVSQEALVFLPADKANACRQLLATTDAADVAAREQAYAAFALQLGRMRDAGVVLLAGSDTPNNCLVPGYSLHWELKQMVQNGLAPIDALRAATVNAVAAIGYEHQTGRVVPGYQADLLVLAANPLEKIDNTRSIRGVMQNGRWYDKEALTKLRLEVKDMLRAASSELIE